jgi:hypothetical protein
MNSTAFPSEIDSHVFFILCLPGSSPNQAEINQRMLHEMVLRNLQPLHTIKVNPLCEKQRKVATYLKKTDKLPKRDL